MTTTEPHLGTQQPFHYSHLEIAIRRAVPADVVSMWHLHTAAVRSLSGGPYTDSEIQAWIDDDTSEKYAHDLSDGKTVLVAEQHGRIVGFTCLCRSEIEALYVHPSHTRHNVGQLLLAAIEREGRQRGIPGVYLDAAMNAVPFYRTCGYRVLGFSMPLFDSGDPLPCVRMHKPLSSSVGQAVAHATLQAFESSMGVAH